MRVLNISIVREGKSKQIHLCLIKKHEKGRRVSDKLEKQNFQVIIGD